MLHVINLMRQYIVLYYQLLLLLLLDPQRDSSQCDHVVAKPVQDTTRNEESDVSILCNCVYVQCIDSSFKRVGYVVAVYDALIRTTLLLLNSSQ